MRSGYRAAILAMALVTAPGVAAAQLQLGAELDGAFPRRDLAADYNRGLGVAGRVGYRLAGIPHLAIVPELQAGYIDFETPAVVLIVSSPAEISLLRFTGGARVSIGEVFRPIAFAHVGYGVLSISETDDSRFTTRSGTDEGALTWDAGLAFDLALLPLVSFGVHVGYNGLATESMLDWWTTGLHADLTF